MNRLIRNNWIKAILVNLIILITVLLLTDLCYETNDDYVIAERIFDGDPYAAFVNYFICRIMIGFQHLVPSVNAFVLFQIALSFAAFVVILKIILDTSKSRIFSLASAFVLAVFSFDHYCAIQFTKTSGILLMAGMLVMIDSMINKRHFLWYIISLVLLYLGAAFRIDGLVVAIGFAGVFLIVWVIENRKKLIPEKYLTWKRIVLYVVLLAFIGGCYGMQSLSMKANTATPELKYYQEYCEARSMVVDYPVYDYYEENSQAYDEIGISENDLYLIDHWYFDYDGAASLDNLNKILKVDSNSDKEPYTIKDAVKAFINSSIGSIKERSFTGVHLILLVLIAVAGLIVLRPRDWIFILLTGAFTVCMYLTIYYMQRPAYRALYIMDIGAAVWLLYYICGRMDEANTSKGKSAVVVVSALVLMAASLLGMVSLADRCDSKVQAAENLLMPAAMQEYMGDRSDCMFVFGPEDRRRPESYAKPILPPDETSEDNSTGTGGWGTESPYVLNKMKPYGIDNPIKDLIDNPKAYLVANSNIDRLEEYYNKWYGSENAVIKIQKIADVEGFEIWQVKSN